VVIRSGCLAVIVIYQFQPASPRTQYSLPLECHRRRSGREGWMQCEGIGKQEAQFQERAMRGRTRRMDLASVHVLVPGASWVLSPPSRTGPFAAFCRYPPSPAMRWPSVLGNLGDGEADGAAAGSSLTTGSRSTTRTRGPLPGDRGSVGSQTATRDPGRRVDSRDESSSRQYKRRAIDVPSAIVYYY
jgi:hypothetical protein